MSLSKILRVSAHISYVTFWCDSESVGFLGWPFQKNYECESSFLIKSWPLSFVTFDWIYSKKSLEALRAYLRSGSHKDRNFFDIFFFRKCKNNVASKCQFTLDKNMDSLILASTTGIQGTYFKQFSYGIHIVYSLQLLCCDAWIFPPHVQLTFKSSWREQY